MWVLWSDTATILKRFSTALTQFDGRARGDDVIGNLTVSKWHASQVSVGKFAYRCCDDSWNRLQENQIINILKIAFIAATVVNLGTRVFYDHRRPLTSCKIISHFVEFPFHSGLLPSRTAPCFCLHAPQGLSLSLHKRTHPTSIHVIRYSQQSKAHVGIEMPV